MLYDLLNFKYIYELRNISHSAKALNITQSALSKSLKRVEAYFGQPLFERRHSGVEPLKAARILYKTVLQMERALLSAKKSITHRRITNYAETFKIGCSTIWNYVYFPKMVNDLEIFSSNLCDIEVGGSSELLRKLAQGYFDFVLCKFEPWCIDHSLLFKTLIETRLALFSRQAEFHEEYSFVGLSYDYELGPANHTVDSSGKFLDFIRTPQITVQTFYSMIELLENGDYCALLPIQFAPILEKHSILENKRFTRYFPNYWCGIGYNPDSCSLDVIEQIELYFASMKSI